MGDSLLVGLLSVFFLNQLVISNKKYSGNMRSCIFVSWQFGLPNNKVIDNKLRGSDSGKL